MNRLLEMRHAALHSELMVTVIELLSRVGDDQTHRRLERLARYKTYNPNEVHVVEEAQKAISHWRTK